MDFDSIMFILGISSLYINIAIGMYGIVSKPNLIKKFIALTILQDSVNVFLIMAGYRRWYLGRYVQPPVLTEIDSSHEALTRFVESSVDPLPQALVLTAIVIGLAVNVFLATIILHLHRHFKTVNMDEIGRLKREVIIEETS